MYCNECGAELPDYSKFCSVCGAKMISLQECGQAVQPMQTGYSYDGQSNYDPSYQQGMQPDYSQSYQQEMQANYNQSYQQEMQSSYVQQSQPVDNKKTNSKIASKKKLPIWAKALITVCVLAVVGVAAFLTIHFIKGKKNGKTAYITINGVKCEFNDKDGISNLDEIENGVLLQNGDSYELYQNGELVKTLEPDEKFSAFVKKEVLNIHEENERNACVSVHLNNNADFEFSDGINEESSEADLEKAGFVCFSQTNNDDERKYTYSKLYDKNGEISVESINSDYNMFLESGFENLNYDLVSYGFPDDRNNFDFSRDKETNRKVLIDRYQNMDIKDYDTFLKFRLLVCREFGKLTGMNAHEYIGSTKDYLVRVDLVYINGKYNDATISIYGPMENLNEYMNNWGVPDFSMFILDAKTTTEHYDTQEDATIEIYDPYIEIRPGADIPEDEGNDESTTEVPVTSYEPYDIANLPEGIDDFLGNFGWYSKRGEDYDCEGYIDYDRFYSSFFNIDIGLYNIHYYDNVYISDEVMDPLNKFEYAYGIDGDRADFVFKNVYNWNDDMIQAAKDNVDSYYYFYDGNYYAYVGGVGGGFVPQIKSVEFNGERYHITYDLYTYGEGDEFIGTYYAELEYKIIDGKGYWSIYKDSITPFF